MSSERDPGAEASLTRREALAKITSGGTALLLASCGMSPRRAPGANGSTLLSSYVDPGGDGILEIGDGIPLLDRQELAPRALPGVVLCTIAHLTDVHVLDEQSPARVPFLRRLGAPFNSTFRPQEAFTAHVLAGAVRAIGRLAPNAVIQGGDLIDNAQGNELELALELLRGGPVDPASGGRGYVGVQAASNPDPLYYRPDLDAPRHPGILAASTKRFTSTPLSVPWHPVLGDHDILVQGVLAPSKITREIALGTRAIWDLPAHLRIPGDLTDATITAASSSPDGLAAPAVVGQLIQAASKAPAVTVPADPARRELDVAEVLARLRATSGSGGAGERMDYSFDVGSNVRVIVLDLVRREGGSGGLVHGEQRRWLAHELARAGRRWRLLASHQPLTSSEGGEALLALLDRDPRVLAAIWGHTHRNRIIPRATRAGGYWLIATCSLIDYPQELRALRVRETAGGGAALETWMIDHVPDGEVGDVSRELSYLDSQGGRPQAFQGGRLDRNVRLFKAAPSGD